MGQNLHIAGPHQGFDPASHLGGERFEAQWMRAMTNPMLQFHWAVRESVAASAEGELTPNHHFRKIRSTRGLRRVLSETRALRAVYKKYPLDLIRLHSVHAGAPTAAALRAAGVRVPLLVQHHHNEEPLKKYRARVRLLAKLGAHFAAVSKASSIQLLALGVRQPQITVIRSVLPGWRPEYTNLALSSGDERDYDLVFVGSLVPRKRPDLVLQTAIELQKMTPGRRIEVAIVGRGEQLDELRGRAEAARLNVDFFTGCDDAKKWDILRRSRIFLFPSAQEGFGYAALEAALAGLWVISSDAGALPETLMGLTNATCIRKESLHAVYLASACRDRLKSQPQPVAQTMVDHWTDSRRWAAEHEKLLREVAARA